MDESPPAAPTPPLEPPWEPTPEGGAADLAILAEVEGELDDVERALERLDAGSYGTCEVCGTVIEDARLQASPATRSCGEHHQVR